MGSVAGMVTRFDRVPLPAVLARAVHREASQNDEFDHSPVCP